MSYIQSTSEERDMIAAFRWHGHNYAEIGAQLGRHRSTIMREVKRNRCNEWDYRAFKADSKTRRRRRECRRQWRFSDDHLRIVNSLLRLDWSPEQIAGWLRLWRVFNISHETIYRYVWYDRIYGSYLFTHLRQRGKKRRKRYRAPDSRGVVPGKRHISQRPLGAVNRSRYGHWEIDTVIGAGDGPCIVTLVERKSGYVLIGKLKARTTAELVRKETRKVQNHHR